MPKIGDSLELTPKDLNKFNKKMTDEILWAQKDGWRGHVNRQGHVSMLAPDGEDTVVISANANAVNQLTLGINRYKRRIGEGVEEQVKPKVVAQKWPCARPNCPKVYASEEHLNKHIAVDHEKRLPCPDCDETFKAPNVLGRHRQLKHGYVSPHKAARLKQKANREAKEKNAKGELTEEQREIVTTYLEGSSEKHREEMLQTVGEARESAGRAAKELITGEEHSLKNFEGNPLLGVDVADSAKFDPHFVGRFIEATGDQPIIRDSIDASSLVDDGTGLKQLTADILDDPTKWGLDADGNYTRVDDGTPLLDSPEVFNLQYSNSQAVTAEEIYRETNERIKQERIAALRQQEEPLEFIDERDSWTLDLNSIMDMDIRTVARVLHAAGLKFEMRSWIADKGD